MPPPQAKSTQPQQGQQPPPAQPPPPPPATLIAAIIAALSVALTAAALAAALAKILKAAGVGYLALRAVCILMMSWPESPLEGTGPAQRAIVRINTLRRAQFFLAACKRVQAAVVDARSHGQPIGQSVRDALATEKRYMAQHVAASANRVRAATVVDGAADAYGNLLGWQAILDDRTSEECRAANGGTFTASTPPIIGFPGSVHPACRCRPVKARSGAPSVNEKLAAAGLAGGN